MIKKIGTFLTSTDVLRISDPCYNKEVWCCGTVKNCEIGEWSAFLIYSDEKDWGVRVAENIALFGNISEEDAETILSEKNWKNSDIHVGVDSGQCGIFQDSKYPIGDTGEYGDELSFYGKCCNLTLTPQQGDVLEFGVVSSSGYGDGSYDCLIAETSDKVSAIKLVFIGDDEDEESDEEFEEIN